MAMSSQATATGPIPGHLLNPSYPDNEIKERIEKARAVRQDFEFLHNTPDNPYAPYVWGFQIYRAVYGPGSDERFAAGLARLEAWVRWHVRQSRYDNDLTLWSRAPTDCFPVMGEWDPTDDMAARFQNEVVQYPNMDDVALLSIESEAQPEHFRCIGSAFINWVKSTGVSLSSPVVRYNHCLVIDGLALQNLEKLPAEVPEVMSRRGNGQEGRAERQRVASLMMSAWTWIIDRDSMQRHLEDDTPPKMVFNRLFEYKMMTPAPPWLRLQTYWIQELWFRRSRELMTTDWDTKCQWDDVDPDRVLWWRSNAYLLNQSNYARGIRQTERPIRSDQ